MPAIAISAVVHVTQQRWATMDRPLRPRPPRDVKVVAHRGASLDAPENTAAAFDLALEQGADALELDVHRTADDRLVVWHDDTLERTARTAGDIKPGVISEIRFDDFALCDAGAWFNDRFPARAREEYVGLCPLTLEDVLRRYGHHTELFIELKQAERHGSMVPLVVELLDAYTHPENRHRILSTDAASLIKLHCLRPNVPLVQVLPHRGSWELRLSEIARYAEAISPLRSIAGANMIAAARWRGLEVYPHTVNDGLEARRLAELGADGIISDEPAMLKAALEPHEVREPRRPALL